ncbi:hypothetical protein BKA64DRAFT_675468 [Cadophora sp. MPI-SDFR-AT-0126]|nr:hypothetical protein BKA64DRAFT_675468 [Leotiomycetes sp. MPI-SDFR-AT-0126]
MHYKIAFFPFLPFCLSFLFFSLGATSFSPRCVVLYGNLICGNAASSLIAWAELKKKKGPDAC